MEKLTVQIAKLVGTPNQNSWSQVHSFIPEEEEKKSKRGFLLAIISFSGEEGVEAVATGREILSRFHEEYYGETETKIFSRLTQAVEEVNEEFSQPERKLEIITAALVENIAYLVIKGGGRILLKRGEAVQTLLEGNEEKLATASGYLEEGDFLMLGTNLLFEVIPQGGLQAALNNETPEEVVEAMAPLIHGQSQMARAASLVAMVKKEEGMAEEIGAVSVPEEKAPQAQSAIAGITEKLKTFFGRVPFKLPQAVGRIYLRQREKELKQKKMVLTVAIILILLLGASIVFGSRQRGLHQRQQQFAEISSQVGAALEEGEGLKELNPLKAKEILLPLQSKITELEKLGIETQKLTEVKKRYEQVLTQVVKEHEFSDLPVFFDLSLIREGGRGDKMSLYRTAGAILDSKNKRVFGFDLSQKSIEVLAGGDELNGASSITLYNEAVYVLTEKGILEVKTKTKRTNLVIEKDEEWGEISALGAFGGNLYLVDKSGVIWRYPVSESGFGAKQKWFGAGVSPDLSGIVSMAIDGSVWLLRNDNKILKFTRGAPDAFSVSGLDKDLNSPQSFYNDDETSKIYVLDKGNSRILVLGKTGEYQGQYLWSGMREATDLVVNEAEKKILLLKEDKVYEIKID